MTGESLGGVLQPEPGQGVAVLLRARPWLWWNLGPAQKHILNPIPFSGSISNGPFLLPLSPLLFPWLLAILGQAQHFTTNSMNSFKKVIPNETPTQTNGLTVWAECVCTRVQWGCGEREEEDENL